MPDSPHHRATTIKAFARELGFQLVGITRPEPSAHAPAFHAWLAEGQQGEMHYLARDLELRLDPAKKFPWAKSILCLGISYFAQPPGDPAVNSDVPAPVSSLPPSPPAAKIARYAWGRDYHKIIEAKLKTLERKIRLAFGPASPYADATLQIRAYADTGPLLERELAARAGLGWIGKNTLLLHPRHGSFFVLAEMVLSLELEPDSPLPNRCGTCTRCLDACPTRALTPYSLDARACISYLTLEHRAPIAPEFHAPMQAAGYVVGCDICQDVCPFNSTPIIQGSTNLSAGDPPPSSRGPLPTPDPDFTPRAPAPNIPLADILAWQEQDWDILTRGRATRRAKFPMWQRNAQILADGGTPELATNEDE